MKIAHEFVLDPIKLRISLWIRNAIFCRMALFHKGMMYMIFLSCNECRGRRVLFFVVLLFLTSGLMSTAYGACRIVNFTGDAQARTLTYTFPRSVTIPRNLPVGAVIARAPLASIIGTGRSLLCGARDQVITAAEGDSNATIEQSYGYLLNNGERAGVAYRVLRSGGTAVNLTGNRVVTSSPNGQYWGLREQDGRDFYAEMVLLKTGELIKPGTIFSAGQKLVSSVVSVNGGDTLNAATLSTTGAVTIVPQTCQMTAPSSVSLGNHRSTSFTGVGSLSSATAFNVNIDCTGATTAVYMTMSDPTDNSNTSDRLRLTANSTAKGVAVQIVRNGSPVGLGPDSGLPGTTNQFKLFDANASTPRYTATFQARYIQTEQTVMPGTANSVATFAMSYQ